MAALVPVLGYKVSDSVVYAVWNLMACAFLISTIQCNPACPDGYYYDDVTGNCDHCSDICEKAEEQRTVEKCLNLCPEFQKKKRKCHPQEYYDAVIGRCDSCSSICSKGDDFDSEQLNLCKEVCPDWPIGDTSEGKKGNVTSNDGLILQSNGLSSLTSVIIAVACLVMTVIIIIVVLLVWRCHTGRAKRTDGGASICNKRPQQREQIDSNELELLTAGGEPLAHPQSDDG